MKSDNRPSSIEANFQSAELIVGNQHYLGAHAVKAEGTRPFVFGVAGVHNGTVKVVSKHCAFEQTKAYSNSNVVEFSLPSLKSRCLYQIFVMPQFTASEANKIRWRALTGVLAVRRANSGFVQWAQVRKDDSFMFAFDLMERSRVVMEGCGVHYDKIHDRERFGHEFIPKAPEGVCVLDGFTLSDKGRIPFAVLISVYDRGYSRLSEPEVSFDEWIEVVAESSVSLISFDGRTVFGNQARFRDGSGILRLYTANGRSGFCVLSERGTECSF